MTETVQESLPPPVAAVRWWRALRDATGPGGGAARARFARLRRLDPKDAAAAIPALHEIIADSRARSDESIDGILLMGTVLAHVHDDDRARGVAAALASRKPGSENPLMHPLRFQRLLQTRDDADLHRGMVRAIRLLDGRANVDDLAWSLYSWNDRVRRAWAIAYYENAPARPQGSSNAER